MQRYRLSLFAVFTSAILLITLVSPQNVLAQDETPPPTDTPSITDEPVVPDAQAAAQESAATDAVVPAVQEQASVSEILDQVPDSTDVIVLDADGQPESLASQAAADALVNGDPMWCPTGVLPSGGGCTSSFASFTDLITELATFNESGPGTIYVASSYSATGLNPDVGSDIIFDYGAIGLTDLIFQGGWDFGSNTVVGTSDLTGIGSLQFLDWGAFGFPASLIVRDIVLSGGDSLYIGDSDPGSPITTANVALENVSVTSTNLGTFVGTDGAVSIMNSDFDSNLSVGLDVSSGGDITLNNVTASGNDGDGALLETCSCLAGNISISDSEFLVNGGIGLGVFSDGNVSIDSVHANDNDYLGILALGGGNLTISDTDTFGNDSAGIIVDSDGNVALTGLNSAYNGGIGVGVSSTGNVSVVDSRFGFNAAAGLGVGNGGNVTLVNSAFFDNAAAGPDAGAFVTSDGSVNVSNSFFGNCFLGPSICGDQVVGLIVDSLGPVNVFSSQFNLNTSTGLILMSDGDVYMKNVTADGNGFVGTLVNTPGTVTVCGGSYSYNDRFGFTATAATVSMSEQTLITGNGDQPIDLGPGTILLTSDSAPKKVSQIVESGCEDGQIGLEVRLSNGDSLIGVELDLPNGDRLIVPCPTRGPASVARVDFSQLPESLPDGLAFVSGLQAEAERDDLMVSFVRPAPDAKYTILHWNGAAWVELEGVTTADGMFAVYPVDPGIYVLATK